MSRKEVGLVLSGGGAKGAYQVGVVKALVEGGVQIDAVAGASIGALNAAVLSAAPSLQEGASRLEKLWRALGETSPLQHNFPAYLRLAAASGLTLAGGAFLGVLTRAGIAAGAKSWLDQSDTGLLSPDPLQALMRQYLSDETIRSGLPLYVSVYKSAGGLRDIAATAMAELGLRDTAPSEFMHIQALPPEQQHNALLASAALPVLFAARRIGDSNFADGGMGGWRKSQGNTPVTPLLQAGYSNLIVTHLSEGSVWSRHDFPNANVLEIRPGSPLERDGGAADLLGFDPEKIPSWIDQGYRDTQTCVQRLIEVQTARNAWQASMSQLDSDERLLSALDLELAAALDRLDPNAT